MGTPVKPVTVFGVVGAGNTAATANPSGIVLGLELICQPDKKADDLKSLLLNWLCLH